MGLFRMGEANEWATALGLGTRYCVHRGGNGALCCHMYEDGVFSCELSMQLFDRRHKALRAKFQHASFRGSCSGFPDRKPLVSDGAADGTECGQPWLDDAQQSKRCAEICGAAIEVRRLASVLQKHRKALEGIRPTITPFVAIT